MNTDKPMRPWMPQRCVMKSPGKVFWSNRQSKRAVLPHLFASAFIVHLLDKPRHEALPALQRLLVRALADKQELTFSGGVTVMKVISG